jgi:hypothetical protein
MIPSNQPEQLIGIWRRFGLMGPVYEIVGTGKSLTDGDRVMKIRVLESGEEIDYRLSEVLEDPKER